MQTLAQIRELLDAHGARPKRSLGQNFLIDHNLLRKLVDASGVKPGDLVLEVGPGTGTLTEELLDRGCHVVACELDDTLVRIVHARAIERGNADRLQVVRGDCLAARDRLSPDVLQRLGDRPFSLVANLPYGAATSLIATLLISHPQCRVMAVTIQREVADRLLAKVGTKEYGAVSVVAQAMAHVERIATAPPSCFWPRPEVTSAMVRLTRLDQPLTDRPLALFDLCKRLFSGRRKQLKSILGASAPLPAGIEPHLRPEQLAPAHMVELLVMLPSPQGIDTRESAR